MTISARRRLRISIVTLGLVLAGAGGARAQDQGSVLLTLNPNVQLTKLHPLANGLVVRCRLTFPHGAYIVTGSNPQPIVNRAFAGSVTVKADISLVHLNHTGNPDHTLSADCSLLLVKDLGASPVTSQLAAASAATPAPITSDNWYVVATGSTITWVQTVTFPNTAP